MGNWRSKCRFLLLFQRYASKADKIQTFCHLEMFLFATNHHHPKIGFSPTAHHPLPTEILCITYKRFMNLKFFFTDCSNGLLKLPSSGQLITKNSEPLVELSSTIKKSLRQSNQINKLSLSTPALNNAVHYCAPKTVRFSSKMCSFSAKRSISGNGKAANQGQVSASYIVS